MAPKRKATRTRGPQIADAMELSALPRLPQEVQDQVVENLLGDDASLKACALSSRSFARSSQRILFRRVVLGAPNFPISKHSMSRRRTNKNTRPTDCSRFLNLLTGSSKLIPFVHELVLVEGVPLYNRVYRVPYQWIGSEQALPVLLDMLTAVKHYSVKSSDSCRFIGQTRIPPHVWDCLQRSFSRPTVRQVDLDLLSPIPNRVIANCSGIVNVEICLESIRPFPEDAFNRRAVINTLDISSSNNWLDLSRYVGTDGPFDLRRLRGIRLRDSWRSRVSDNLYYKGATQILNRSKTSLEWLSLKPDLRFLKRADDFSLNAFTLLRRIELDLREYFALSGKSYLDWLTNLFRSVVHNNFIEVIIIVISDFARERIPSEAMWRELGNVLNKARLPRIRAVVFYVDQDFSVYSDHRVNSQSMIEEVMFTAAPDLLKKGVLGTLRDHRYCSLWWNGDE